MIVDINLPFISLSIVKIKFANALKKLLQSFNNRKTMWRTIDAQELNRKLKYN